MDSVINSEGWKSFLERAFGVNGSYTYVCVYTCEISNKIERDPVLLRYEKIRNEKGRNFNKDRQRD